jgi:hypothetical protein
MHPWAKCPRCGARALDRPMGCCRKCGEEQNLTCGGRCPNCGEGLSFLMLGRAHSMDGNVLLQEISECRDKSLAGGKAVKLGILALIIPPRQTVHCRALPHRSARFNYLNGQIGIIEMPLSGGSSRLPFILHRRRIGL